MGWWRWFSERAGGGESFFFFFLFCKKTETNRGKSSDLLTRSIPFSLASVFSTKKEREMNAVAATSRGLLSHPASDVTASSSSSSSNSCVARASMSRPTSSIRQGRPARCTVSALRSSSSSQSSFSHLPPRAMPQRLGAYATGGIDRVRLLEEGERAVVDRIEEKDRDSDLTLARINGEKQLKKKTGLDLPLVHEAAPARPRRRPGLRRGAGDRLPHRGQADAHGGGLRGISSRRRRSSGGGPLLRRGARLSLRDPIRLRAAAGARLRRLRRRRCGLGEARGL